MVDAMQEVEENDVVQVLEDSVFRARLEIIQGKVEQFALQLINVSEFSEGWFELNDKLNELKDEVFVLENMLSYERTSGDSAHESQDAVAPSTSGDDVPTVTQSTSAAKTVEQSETPQTICFRRGLETIATDDAPICYSRVAAIFEHDIDDKKIPANKSSSTKPAVVDINKNDSSMTQEQIDAMFKPHHDKKILANKSTVKKTEIVHVNLFSALMSRAQKNAVKFDDNGGDEIPANKMLDQTLEIIVNCDNDAPIPVEANEASKTLAPATQHWKHPFPLDDATPMRRTRESRPVMVNNEEYTTSNVLNHYASYDPLSPLRLVEATLVEEPSNVEEPNERQVQPTGPVYDVIFLSAEPLPYWKRHQVGLVLIAAAIIGICTVLASIRMTRLSPVPSMAPSSSKAPSSFPSISPSSCGTYRAVSRGAFCDCSADVSFDGDDAVLATDALNIFSNVGGEFEYAATLELNTIIYSVAISGGVAVAGTPENNDYTGAAYIVEKDSFGNWSQVERIQPGNIAQGSYFGWSVDIDGDVMVIGATDDGERSEGSAFIYRRVNATWVLEAKIAPADSNLNAFGNFVSVKGNLVAVGDHSYGKSEKGAVFVYEFDSLSNSWTQLKGPITNPDCDGNFGATVVLEGKELLIACAGEDRGSGAVYFYSKSDARDHYEFQQKIVASDGAPRDEFGSWNRIAVDKNIMLVATENYKKVYVFSRDESSVWKEVDKIVAPTGAMNYGYTIALSGRTALVSSDNSTYSYLLEKC